MSKRVNWKKLAESIPFRVQLTDNEYWEIVWVANFPDGDTCGECRYDMKQIAIMSDLSNKLKVITYLHELDHAFSFINEAGLTETQILKNEKSYYYRLKPGNIFNE